MAYRQDLSQAQNGAVTGRGGNVQQLGPAALRRLQSMGVISGGTGGQTPGIVPPMPPSATQPGPQPAGGYGGAGDYVDRGPSGPTATPWAGGPQSLGVQGIQQAIDTYHIPGSTSGDVMQGGANGAGGTPHTFPMPQSMMPQEPFQIPGQQPPTPTDSPNIQAAIQGIRAQLGAPKPGMPVGGAGTPWQSPPIANVPGGPNTRFKPRPGGPQPPPITGTSPGAVATKPMATGPSPMVPNEPSQGGAGTGGTNMAGGAQPPNPVTEMLKKRISSATGMDGTAYY